jgi:phage tail tape-measure protein
MAAIYTPAERRAYFTELAEQLHQLTATLDLAEEHPELHAHCDNLGAMLQRLWSVANIAAEVARDQVR